MRSLFPRKIKGHRSLFTKHRWMIRHQLRLNIIAIHELNKPRQNNHDQFNDIFYSINTRFYNIYSHYNANSNYVAFISLIFYKKRPTKVNLQRLVIFNFKDQIKMPKSNTNSHIGRYLYMTMCVVVVQKPMDLLRHRQT